MTYNVFREWPATGLHRPDKRLLLASDGNFYGSNNFGGAANRGGIYRITPTGGYTELLEFDNSPDGYGLGGDLIEGAEATSTVAPSTPRGSFSASPRMATSSRVKVKVRSLDNDGKLSGLTTVRARRAE